MFLHSCVKVFCVVEHNGITFKGSLAQSGKVIQRVTSDEILLAVQWLCRYDDDVDIGRDGSRSECVCVSKEGAVCVMMMVGERASV